MRPHPKPSHPLKGFVENPGLGSVFGQAAHFFLMSLLESPVSAQRSWDLGSWAARGP